MPDDVLCFPLFPKLMLVSDHALMSPLTLVPEPIFSVDPVPLRFQAVAEKGVKVDDDSPNNESFAPFPNSIVPSDCKPAVLVS